MLVVIPRAAPLPRSDKFTALLNSVASTSHVFQQLLQLCIRSVSIATDKSQLFTLHMISTQLNTVRIIDETPLIQSSRLSYHGV